MRLSQLDATFVGDWHPGSYQRLESLQGAQGLLFQCPACAAGKAAGGDGVRGWIEGAHYVLCWFLNPVAAERVPDDATPGPGRWTFSGTSLEDATLSPSVNLDTDTGRNAGRRVCRWHGSVTNGEAA